MNNEALKRICPFCELGPEYHSDCSKAMMDEVERLRTLLLDMRQHQGAIQPYVKRIDAALGHVVRGEGKS